MLKVFAAAALLIGAASHSLAPPPAPALCRVIAKRDLSHLPWLINITVALRPDCPPGGEANVRLLSELGSTDPPNDWLALTPCRPGGQTCTITWRGVLLHPLNWHPQWRAASGRPYDVPLQP
jgi:hypothetical protein